MKKPTTRTRDYCGHCKKSRVIAGDLGIDVYAVHAPLHSMMQILVPLCRHCWRRITSGAFKKDLPVCLSSRGFKRRPTLRQRQAAARAEARRASRAVRELRGFES